MTEALARARPRIDAPKELDRVVRRLIAAFDQVGMYLFGSRARGDAQAASDYDLLVILPDFRQGEELKEVCQESGMNIHPHFRTQVSFAERRYVVGTLEHEVEAEGVRLYAAPGWNLTTGVPPSIRVSIQVVRDWLGRADWHIAAADSASGEVPDQASVHVEWAAENLSWAALVAHARRPAFGRRIGEAARLLPGSFALRERLLALDFLSGNAAAFRYPVGDRSLKRSEPSVAEARAWIAEVKTLKADFERWLAEREAQP
jgi:predicted nucleotidyltransferase